MMLNIGRFELCQPCLHVSPRAERRHERRTRALGGHCAVAAARLALNWQISADGPKRRTIRLLTEGRLTPETAAFAACFGARPAGFEPATSRSGGTVV